MTSPVQTLRKNIDFHSYSSATGFLGFFERKGAFSIDLCEKAIDLLLSEPLFDLSSLSIVSNLFCFGDDTTLKKEYDELEDRQLREYVHPLISEGLLTRLGPSDDCRDRQDGDSFSVRTGVTGQMLRTVCFAAMAVDGVRGHCFGVADDCNLIFYPHWESGFGFISTSPKASQRQYLQDYIARQFSDTDFQITLW